MLSKSEHHSRFNFAGSLVLTTWLGLATFSAAAAEQFTELRLSTAVEYAVANSPGLAAIDSKTRALGTRAEQDQALPDPMLSVGAMNLPVDTFDFDQEPMTQLQVSLSQPLPYPGKRKLQREIAELTEDQSQSRWVESKQQLVGKVRQEWWHLYAAEKTLEIIETNLSLLEDFLEIARAKYTVGSGLQQDALLAELEISRLLKRQLAEQGRRDSSAARLAGLMNLAVGSIVSVSAEPGDTRLPDIASDDVLAAKAIDSRSLLSMHRSRVAAADKRLDLAEKQRYPDFRVGVGYGLRDGTDPFGDNRPDFFSVMFSMNLPIYSKTKQGKFVEQRFAEKQHEVLLLDDAVRALSAEIGEMSAGYRVKRQQVELLRDTLIPQAERTVQSMLAGYQVNKVDFLNVVNGQLMLYDARINYYNALGTAKGRLAKLAVLTGEESLYE